MVLNASPCGTVFITMNHTRKFLVAALTVAPIVFLPTVALADSAPAASRSVTTGTDAQARGDVRVVAVADLSAALTVREVKDVLRANGEVRLALDLNVVGEGGLLGGLLGGNERNELIDANVLANVLVDVDADAEILEDLLVKADIDADAEFVADVDAYLDAHVEARSALQEHGIDLDAVIALSVNASGDLTVISE